MEFSIDKCLQDMRSNSASGLWKILGLSSKSHPHELTPAIATVSIPVIIVKELLNL